MLGGVVFSTLRTFFHRQRRHRALQPAAIERVIGIGSKYPFVLNYEILRTSAIEYKAGSFPISHFAARSAPPYKGVSAVGGMI